MTQYVGEPRDLSEEEKAVLRDPVKMIKLTLEHMRDCGSWHRPTMDRVIENVDHVARSFTTSHES